MTTLGAGKTGVAISERSGRIVWQSTDRDLIGWSWGRVWCETSTAQVEFAAPARIANLVEPLVHLLTVYRDDDLVWHGLILHTSARRGYLTVTAFDGSVLYDKRRVTQRRSYRMTDVSTILRDLTIDGLGMDDPTQLVDTMTIAPSRIWVQTEIHPAERMISEEVKDLADSGLVWTVAAGRLIGGPIPGQHTTAVLSDRWLDADLTVVKDGAEVVTDLHVIGKGVHGTWTNNSTPVGRIQAIEKADKLTRDEECVAHAQRTVTESLMPPRRLIVPGGARLSSDTPITIDQLIPGVHIPVSTSQTGITVGSTMALQSVTVSGDQGGEKVAVTLMDIPAADLVDDATLFPPPIVEDYNSPYDRERREKEMQTTEQTESRESGGTGVAPV